MIRSVIALFAFSVVLCLLIVLRPFADNASELASTAPASQDMTSDVQVTRAATPQNDTALLAEAALANVVELPQPTPAVAAVAPARIEAPRRVDVARPETDDTSLNDMTQNVLAELGFVGVEPVITPGQAQRETTADILAGIASATGMDAQVAQRDTLEGLVVAALRAGTSDEGIDTLVNAAAAAGQVAVPEILVTSEGRVDTHVLLSNIVTQAQIAAGNIPAIPNTTPDNTTGLEVRVTQQVTREVQSRFYTVQPGDSLGAIAITFYGRSDAYDHIYLANRQILSSPDRIRVGQRLVIPQI